MNYILNNTRTRNQFPMVYSVKNGEMTIAHHEEIKPGDQFVSQKVRGLTCTVSEVVEQRKARGKWTSEVPDFFRVKFTERVMENEELTTMEFANDN